MNIDGRWAGIDAEACYCYTLGRQTPRGGFSFYASPEWGVAKPNAPDTYAAVAILALFGRLVPRMDDCAIWLADQQDRSGGFPTLIIGVAVLKGLRLLGAQPSWDPRSYLREQGEMLWLGDASNRNRNGWLASARRCIALWQDYGLPTSEPTRDGIAVALRHLRAENGGYGTPGASLSETARALALADAVGLPVDGEALAYARLCEGAPFGFNIASAAVSSNVESQYAGIRVLRYFGSYPRYPLLVRNYIASCQTSVGGFGRAPGRSPGWTIRGARWPHSRHWKHRRSNPAEQYRDIMYQQGIAIRVRMTVAVAKQVEQADLNLHIAPQAVEFAK